VFVRAKTDLFVIAQPKQQKKIFLSSGTVAAQGGKQFVFFWQGVRGFGFCDSIESAGKNFKKSRNTV